MQYPLEVSVSNCYSGGMANEMDALRLRIERLMKAQGRSARSLSLAIGQNSAYIQQLISGMRNKKPPSIQIMEAIADELGVSLEVLRGREPEFDPLPEVQTIPLATLLKRMGATPYRGYPIDDLEASAGQNAHVVQGFDDARSLGKRGDKNEPVQNVMVTGDCMVDLIYPGDVVAFDTRVLPNPNDVVVASRFEGETLVKFLRVKDERQYLESKDGTIVIPLDQYIRVLGPVVSVQKSMRRLLMGER